MSAEDDAPPPEESWRWSLWSPKDRVWQKATQELWNSLEAVEERKSPIIPLKIHQIWLGGGSPPEECKKSMATWRNLHPSWEYHLWLDADAERELSNVCPWLLEGFLQATNLAEKSDLLRLAVVLRHGGLYVDVDFDCLRPFDCLHHKFAFYTGESNVGAFELNNGLFAACPGHPAVRFLCDHVGRPWPEWGGDDVDQREAVAFQLAKSGALSNFGISELMAPQRNPTQCLETTGPGFFTRGLAVAILRPFCAGGDGSLAGNEDGTRAVICPRSYFYPLQNKARKLPREERLAKALPESFALHHWCRTWMKDEDLVSG